MSYDSMQQMQGDVLLGKVGIPLPGGGVTMKNASVISIGGESSWYQFSSERLMMVPSPYIPRSISNFCINWFNFMRYYYNILSNNANRNHRHDEDSEAGILLTDKRSNKKNEGAVSLGSIVNERTKVERELYSKMTAIVHNRRTHGAVLVSVKWSLPKKHNSYGVDGSGAGGSGSGDFDDYDNDDEAILGGHVSGDHPGVLSDSSNSSNNELHRDFKLPGEKLELESGMLVGLKSRQRKPWQQSIGHKPSSWPRPTFTRESGFLNTLPDSHHIDPLDYRDGALLRHHRHHHNSSHHSQHHLHSNGHHHHHSTGFGGPEDDIILLAGSHHHRVHPHRSSNHLKVMHQSHKRGNNAYNCRKNEIIAGMFAPSTLKDRGVGLLRHDEKNKMMSTTLSSSASTDSSSSSSMMGTTMVPTLHKHVHHQAYYGQMRSLVNPENFTEPARHVLLKLRKTMPLSPIFTNHPIPISEKEILKNESYRELLRQVGWLVTPQEYESALKEDIALLKEANKENNNNNKTDANDKDYVHDDDVDATTAAKKKTSRSGDEILFSIAAIRQTLGLVYAIALELGPANSVQQTTLYNTSYRKHSSTLMSSTLELAGGKTVLGKSATDLLDHSTGIKHLGNKPYYSSNQLAYRRSSVLVDLINHYRSLKQRKISGSENSRFIANKINATIDSIVQEFEVNVRFDPLDLFELDNLLPTPHRKMRPATGLQVEHVAASMAASGGGGGAAAPVALPSRLGNDSSSQERVVGEENKSDERSASQSRASPGGVAASSSSSSSYLKKPEKGPEKVIIQVIQAENIPFKKTNHHSSNDDRGGGKRHGNRSFQENASMDGGLHSPTAGGRSKSKKEGWEAAVLLLGEDDEADIHQNVLEEEFKAHVCVQV
jgi:hypothetical protein